MVVEVDVAKVEVDVAVEVVGVGGGADEVVVGTAVVDTEELAEIDVGIVRVEVASVVETEEVAEGVLDEARVEIDPEVEIIEVEVRVVVGTVGVEEEGEVVEAEVAGNEVDAVVVADFAEVEDI